MKKNQRETKGRHMTRALRDWEGTRKNWVKGDFVSDSQGHEHTLHGMGLVLQYSKHIGMHVLNAISNFIPEE